MMRTRLVWLAFALLGLGCTVHERSLQYDDDGGTPGGSGGAGGSGGNVCSSTSTSPCTACVNANCCAEFSACFASTACQNLLTCEADCTGSACGTCTTQYPTGVSPLNALLNCTSLHCHNECTSGGGDAGTGGTTLASAIAQTAATICGKMRDCSPGLLAWRFGTYDECVTRSVALDTFVSGLADVSLSASTYTACGNAYAAVSCSQFVGADPNECWTPGNRANGQGCNAGDQCASMFCKQNAWSCGTCAPMPAVGAACLYAADCGRGTWCTAGTCQKPRLLGETCTTDLPCSNELVCDTDKCAAAPAVQEASCDAAVGRYCSWTQSLYCASNGKCVTTTWVATGQTCSASTTSASLCQKSGSCTSGICVAAPADHNACDPADDKCEWPAVCSSAKTCMVPSDAPICAK